MTPKLEVRDLSFAYADKPVLEGLSFSVMLQEFVSILGSSGCGKSTILNVLSGLLRPLSGEMRVDGQRIEGISDCFAVRISCCWTSPSARWT